MYKSFYSLSKIPFSKELDVNDAFLSTSLSEAEARFDYLKQTKGISLLIGEPGAGKTFCLRRFASTLHQAQYKVIYFPMSTGSVMDFYQGLAYGLGEEPKFRKTDLFRQIQQGIERLYTERRITPVFILDEMHLSKDAFLKDLCLLYNFQMDSVNPFILVIAGLPHLKERLGLNQHLPLSQRIVMRFQMNALEKEEVPSYIDHHMKLAGSHMPIFQESALEALALRSQGWPRILNTLATHSLLIGYQQKKQQIDEEVVRLAADEVGL